MQAAAGAPVVVLPAGLRMVPIVGIGLAVAVVALALTPLGIGAAALGALGTWLLLLGLHVGVPRFLGAREYNTLLGAFVALLLATLIGCPGLILAPPLAAAIQIAIESLFRSRHAAAGTLATVADVRARYAQLVAELQSKPWTSKRTLGLLDNLGHLLGDVEDIEPPPGPLPPPDQSPVLFGSVSP